MPVWRNWQTRWTKDPVLKGVGVQVSLRVPFLNYASVAQLEVQHPSKVKVAGSSPVRSTRGKTLGWNPSAASAAV